MPERDFQRVPDITVWLLWGWRRRSPRASGDESPVLCWNTWLTQGVAGSRVLTGCIGSAMASDCVLTFQFPTASRRHLPRLQLVELAERGRTSSGLPAPHPRPDPEGWLL